MEEPQLRNAHGFQIDFLIQRKAVIHLTTSLLSIYIKEDRMLGNLQPQSLVHILLGELMYLNLDMKVFGLISQTQESSIMIIINLLF